MCGGTARKAGESSSVVHLCLVPPSPLTTTFLLQQTQNVLGAAIEWDGSRRDALVGDFEKKYSDIPCDQLLRLLKTPRDASSSKPPFLLRRLTGSYSPWNTTQRDFCAQLSRRLSDMLGAAAACLQRMNSCRINRTVLLKSKPYSEDSMNTIDLVDDSTDMPAVLHEIGRNKELMRLENEISTCAQDMQSQKAEAAVVKITLSENGFALGGLHRANVDSGLDWLSGRMLGLLSRGRTSCGPIGRALQPSSSRMVSKIIHRFQRLWTISGHMLNPAYCSVFDNTGRYLLTGADDYLIKIWDINAGLLVKTCRGHEQYISYIAVSPDNSLFASGCTRGIIRVWRLCDGVCLHVMQHGASVNWLKFDACTGALASASDDGQCIVWDLSKMIPVDRLCSPLFQQAAAIKFGQSDDSTFLSQSTCSTDTIDLIEEAISPVGKGLFLWSRADCQASSSTPSQPTCMLALQHIPDSTLASAEDSLKVLCLDVAAMGRILVTGCEDGVARVWRFDYDNQQYDVRERKYLDGMLPMMKHSMSPIDFAKVERVANHLLLRLEGHVCPVTDIQMNSLGDRVLTGSAQDGSVRIWSLSKDYSKSVHIILELSEEDEEAVQIVSNRQRNRVRTRSTIQVYNACWTVDDLRVITVQSVPKSSNDDVLQPTRLKVWDSMNGDLLRVIRNISDTASKCLVRHPLNPNIVTTAGEDGFINVWDIDVEERLSQNRLLLDDGQPAAVIDGSMSADGTYLAVTDVLGRVTLLGLDDPERFARNGAMYPEQYFSTDYAPFILDDQGYAIDVGTQLPVNNSPVGALCNINTTAYVVQPKPPASPQTLSQMEVQANLQRLEIERSKIPREMDRVFNIFSKNKYRGREPRRYRSGDKFVGFRATVPAKSKPRNAKFKSKSTPQYIDFDINQYQPSSDDDDDDDWEQRRSLSPAEEDVEEDDELIDSPSVGRPTRRNNARSLSNFRQSERSLRRSARSQGRNPNYDDSDLHDLYPNMSLPNTALTRSQRAQARTNRGRGFRTLNEVDFDDDDWEHESHITIDSDELSIKDTSSEEEMANSDEDDVAPRRKLRSAKARSTHKGRKGRRVRSVGENNGEHESNDEPVNSLVMLSDRPKPTRRSPRASGPQLKWKTATMGCSTVPLQTTIDRSWLQLSSQDEALYCPQLGDKVIYFPQGHREQLHYFPNDLSPPWLAFPSKWPFVECEVRGIQFEFPTMHEHRSCPSVLAILTLAVVRIPLRTIISAHGQYITELTEPRATRHNTPKEHIFKVTLRNSGLADFLVPTVLFLRSVHLPWHQGIRLDVNYKESDPATGEMISHRYPGRLVKLACADEDWPQSPWESLVVEWDDQVDGGPGADRVSPWEARAIWDANSGHAQSASRFKLPCLDAAEAKRIDLAIQELMEAGQYAEFEFEVDSSVFQDYYCIVPAPVYVDLIRRRLQENFYRQVDALDFDINQISVNCELYNSQGSDIVAKAVELRDALHDIVYPDSNVWNHTVPSNDSADGVSNGGDNDHTGPSAYQTRNARRVSDSTADDLMMNEAPTIRFSKRKRSRSDDQDGEEATDSVIRFKRRILPRHLESPQPARETRSGLSLFINTRTKQARRGDESLHQRSGVDSESDEGSPPPVRKTRTSNQNKEAMHPKATRSSKAAAEIESDSDHSSIPPPPPPPRTRSSNQNQETIPARITRRSGAAAQPETESDFSGDSETDEEDDEDEENVSPRKATAAPTKTALRRKASAYERDDDDEDDGEEESPKYQKATRRAAASSAIASRTTRSKGCVEEEEEEKATSASIRNTRSKSNSGKAEVEELGPARRGATTSTTRSRVNDNSFQAHSADRLEPVVAISTRRGRSDGGDSLLSHDLRVKTEDCFPHSRSGRAIKAPLNFTVEQSHDTEGSRRKSKPVHDQATHTEPTSRSNNGRRIDPDLKRLMVQIISHASVLDEKTQAFGEAVDPDESPDYYEIVPNPVDLSTIR